MSNKEDISEIVDTLHPLELKLLPNLKKFTSFDMLKDNCDMKEIEIMRALQWLSNKKLVDLVEEKKTIVTLDKEGKNYLKKGLPEKRLLQGIKDSPKTSSELIKEGTITQDELNISIGTLKKNAAINIEKKNSQLNISITDQGKNILNKDSFEEKFLKKDFPISFDEIKDLDKLSFDNLIKRKNIIKKEEIKSITATLTSLGKDVANTSSNLTPAIDRLTSEHIKSNDIESKTFRRYDVSINVPKEHGGKRHFYSDFIYQIRKKLVELGFIEMTGPNIELEFWNFDALFSPQNHPSRSTSDTYSLRYPKKGKLPDKKIVEQVKKAHETGGKTGSTGWGYKWDPKIAMNLMPRAHDTAISPRYLSKDVKIPGKYFSLVRCYRPDVIDATHGVEFNQLGGIIIDKDLNFRNLLGILKEFAMEITGVSDVKFFPDYFPFTEPSCQISVKDKKKGWMELAGAGVFRPELTEPLGIKEPVIAWGFGIDRLAMVRLGITDIRDLFSQDIEFLRNHKVYLE